MVFVMIFTGWFCRGLVWSKSLLPIILPSTNVLWSSSEDSNPDSLPFYPVVIRFLILNQPYWIHPTWNYDHYRLPVSSKGNNSSSCEQRGWAGRNFKTEVFRVYLELMCIVVLRLFNGNILFSSSKNQGILLVFIYVLNLYDHHTWILQMFSW